MLKLYSYYQDCGRMGDLTSLFIADDSKVAEIIGKSIYFGEVLGKHSEIVCDIEEGDFTVKSDDQDFIKKFIEIMGADFSTGHNPLDYYDPKAEE